MTFDVQRHHRRAVLYAVVSSWVTFWSSISPVLWNLLFVALRLLFGETSPSLSGEWKGSDGNVSEGVVAQIFLVRSSRHVFVFFLRRSVNISQTEETINAELKLSNQC